MQQTIAKEMKISIRYVREITKRLESLGLITITKMGRKYHYAFPFIAEPQFLYEPVDNSQQRNPSSPIQRNPSSGHRGTGVPTNNKVSNKEVKNIEKSFYENGKKHGFADSMDQMANEQKHIDEHEKIKSSLMPDNLREQIRGLSGKMIVNH